MLTNTGFSNKPWKRHQLKAVHPFIVRNWRKATNGSMRVVLDIGRNV